ncbi:hypothetical protein MMC25_001259 [Agyrium rufum]|nr:hypothetical protein [Agyrium rufum]
MSQLEQTGAVSGEAASAKIIVPGEVMVHAEVHCSSEEHSKSHDSARAEADGHEVESTTTRSQYVRRSTREVKVPIRQGFTSSYQIADPSPVDQPETQPREIGIEISGCAKRPQTNAASPDLPLRPTKLHKVDDVSSVPASRPPTPISSTSEASTCTVSTNDPNAHQTSHENPAEQMNLAFPVDIAAYEDVMVSPTPPLLPPYTKNSTVSSTSRVDIISADSSVTETSKTSQSVGLGGRILKKSNETKISMPIIGSLTKTEQEDADYMPRAGPKPPVKKLSAESKTLKKGLPKASVHSKKSEAVTSREGTSKVQKQSLKKKASSAKKMVLTKKTASGKKTASAKPLGQISPNMNANTGAAIAEKPGSDIATIQDFACYDNKPLADVRPLPIGAPPIWSSSRQFMCETLPYYRAYESGIYATGGIAYGFLLDRDYSFLPHMDHEVVITRAGGGCVNDAGTIRQIKSHDISRPDIQSIIRNMRLGIPIALIVEKDNANCPVQVPFQYCVLDWFVVTDVWAELQNKVVSFKYRFEKLDLTTQSWWAPIGSTRDNDQERLEPSPTKRALCQSCGNVFPQVYEVGWICLNPDCIKFFKINGKRKETTVDTYNPAFLKGRKAKSLNVRPAMSLSPSLIAEEDIGGGDELFRFSRAMWKGFVCPKCNGCNPRKYWNVWRCLTNECDFVHMIQQPILSWRSLLDGHATGVTGHALPLDTWHPSAIKAQSIIQGNWRISKYELMEGNWVTHYQPNMTVNAAPRSSNELLTELQKGNCMNLQRFPRQQSSCKGEFLTTNFSMNFGFPYKYIVNVDCKGFKDASLPILQALQRLTWAGKSAVQSENFRPFNELLAVGYLQGGKMDYHDDGEVDLSPTIATLSLGGVASMTMRMKRKPYTGVGKGGSYDSTAPVLPGAWLKEERQLLNAKAVDLSKEDLAKNARRMLDKQFKNGIGNKKRPHDCAPLLNMHLAHGDMVVMHGAEMQRYYEHSVVSHGYLRFALTSRHVKPNNIPPEHHWKGDYDQTLVRAYDGTDQSHGEI